MRMGRDLACDGDGFEDLVPHSFSRRPGAFVGIMLNAPKSIHGQGECIVMNLIGAAHFASLSDRLPGVNTVRVSTPNRGMLARHPFSVATKKPRPSRHVVHLPVGEGKTIDRDQTALGSPVLKTGEDYVGKKHARGESSLEEYHLVRLLVQPGIPGS
jgi:hypothetical protein